MVKGVKLEQPSIDFSKTVMDAIYEIESAKQFKKSKPLISRYVWLFLIGLLVIATFYLFKNVGLSNSGIFSKIDLATYFSSISSYINFNFKASKITLYGFIFFAIVVSIQIGYIKNYYNSRFD